MGILLRAGGARAGAAGDQEPASPRRPWWIWVAPFGTLLVVLIARNWFLFSTRLYEQGDSGANSILIQQALRFQLLVGHYSREKFNHPGPAYLYVQAFGQWMGRDVMHVVPTDWNGQFLAVYALEAAMMALTVAVVYGVTGSIGSAAAAFCVLLGFAAWHPGMVTGNWMPYLLVLTFVVFLLAAASVATRHKRDLWVLTLSGCLLIHGYAPNLLFVPLLVVAAAVTALWPQRRRPAAAVAEFFRSSPRAWLPAVVIFAAFALPIMIKTLGHWPGEFGKYLSYDNSSRAGGHPASQVVRYMLWFWWPYGTGAAVAIAIGLAAAALAVTLTLTSGRPRAWSLTVIGFAVLTTAAFWYYVATSLDGLAYYIGYFFWAVPASLALIVVTGLVRAVSRVPAADSALVTLAVAVLIVFGLLGRLHSSTQDNNPGLPAAVATLAADSHGKPIVITGAGQSWVLIPGFLVQAERTGVTACVANPIMTYLVSRQMICSPHERHTGIRYAFGATPPPGTRPIVRAGSPEFGYTYVTRLR